MSLSIQHKQPIIIDHSRQPSVGRFVCDVCVSVQCILVKRLTGYGMDAVWDGSLGRSNGPGMRQVDGFEDRSMGRGNFGGEFGAPNCNQWGLCGATRPCS